MQLGTVERVVREPGFETGHRTARGGMRVHDTMGRGNVSVNRTVGDKPREIYGVLSWPDGATLNIHGHQIGCGDLAVVQAEGIDQEDRLGTRNPQGNVVEYRLRPSQQVEHSVARGELQPGAALRVGERNRASAAAGRLIQE